MPVVRERLRALEGKFGFDPRGHTGKALAHAVGAMPHDLAVAFEPEALETLALASMSLADRPRPRLVLVPSPLRRHLYAFVWLPRDELNTARRVAIGEMLKAAAGAGSASSRGPRTSTTPSRARRPRAHGPPATARCSSTSCRK